MNPRNSIAVERAVSALLKLERCNEENARRCLADAVKHQLKEWSPSTSISPSSTTTMEEKFIAIPEGKLNGMS